MDDKKRDQIIVKTEDGEKMEIDVPYASIAFALNGHEVIRCTPSGFHVEGRFVIEDAELYHAFVRYFKVAGQYTPNRFLSPTKQ